MRISAVLTDLDGTLLRQNESISEASLEAINELAEQNIALIPVTGRDYYDIAPVLASYGIDKDFGVFSGGAALVELGSGEYREQRSMPLELSRAIVSELCEISETISYDNTKHTPQSAMHFPPTTAPMSLWSEIPTSNISLLENLRLKYKDLNFYLANLGDMAMTGVHISSSRVNKGYMAVKVLELMSLKPEESLAIGDGSNDIPLFAVTGVSVAMGNARREVQNQAMHTTGTCENDGFAAAMRMHVLGR